MPNLAIICVMHFSDKLAAVIHSKNSCLMLGLDPNWEKLPTSIKTAQTLQAKADIYEKFCCDMVDVCADKVCGIKIQMGYFEALGSVGVKAVENLIAFTRAQHPELIIMMDAKRGDIGSTSEAYAQAFLGSDSPLSGDCVTVAPYMGTDSIKPFLDISKNNAKGLFVLAKTSNPSSKEIQDVAMLSTVHSNLNWTVSKYWAFLYEELCHLESLNGGSVYGSHGAVVGATHSEDLKEFRELMPSAWLLCPGVGAQGGKIEDVLAIRDEDGLDVLIPVSRAVLYAGNQNDYLAKAKEAMEELWAAQKL